MQQRRFSHRPVQGELHIVAEALQRKQEAKTQANSGQDTQRDYRITNTVQHTRANGVQL